MIIATPTTTDDFRDLTLIKNGVYPRLKFTQKYINNLFKKCSVLLTFRNKCGILGIIGLRERSNSNELFAYISDTFRTTFKREYLSYTRRMVRMLRQKVENKELITYVRDGHQAANKFVQFLGFRDSGITYNDYAVYTLWQE